MVQRFSLVAFDLDGTLLDDKKQIPPENLAALWHAHERGLLLVPATGRIPKGLPKELLALPLRYALLVNGAMVYDLREQKTLAKSEIPLPLALELIDMMETLPCLYDCYFEGWGYMNAAFLSRAPEIVTDPGILELVETLRTPVPSLRGFLEQQGRSVQKLQMYFPAQEQPLRRRLLAELPERFPELSVTTSVSMNIELNYREANKGRALRQLCETLGVPLERCLAFGDGTNDLSLLQAAGLGIAMGNSAESVKAAADLIAPTNNEAGLGQVLEKLLV